VAHEVDDEGGHTDPDRYRGQENLQEETPERVAVQIGGFIQLLRHRGHETFENPNCQGDIEKAMGQRHGEVRVEQPDRGIQLKVRRCENGHAGPRSVKGEAHTQCECLVLLIFGFSEAVVEKRRHGPVPAQRIVVTDSHRSAPPIEGGLPGGTVHPLSHPAAADLGKQVRIAHGIKPADQKDLHQPFSFG
jgi:hypothetical protein